MLGIEDYGSSSDTENDDTTTTSTAAKSSLAAKLPLPSKKPAFPLPPPLARTSKTALPPKRGPKKITISLPTLTATDDNNNDDLKDERPAAKKPRLESGAGLSSLLSMLPVPKQKNPTLPVPERVLGGGTGPGLVFNTTRAPASTSISHLDNGGEADEDADLEESESRPSKEQDASMPEALSTPFSFLPPSLTKGRSNISVEEGGKTKPPARTAPPEASSVPAVDFFSLGTSKLFRRYIMVLIVYPGAPTSTSSSSKASLPSNHSTPTHTLPNLSSAPVIPTFTPPTPTPTDAYPGYYQLPSGSWAVYDSEYYATFVKKWESEYNAHVRALEKGMVKGFEGMESATVEEVDAMKEMEKAKLEMRDREEKKAVTKGADGGPVAPRMNINVSVVRVSWGFIWLIEVCVGGKIGRESAVKASVVDTAE